MGRVSELTGLIILMVLLAILRSWTLATGSGASGWKMAIVVFSGAQRAQCALFCHFQSRHYYF